MRNRYKPVNPDKIIRDLRKEFKKIQKGDPEFTSPEQLADFTKRAHDLRMINKAMHVAKLCLDADPDRGQDLIRDAYLAEANSDEDRLRTFASLVDLGRWLENDRMVDRAQGDARELAPGWIGEVNGSERRTRMRDLASMFGDDFADRALAKLY